MYGAVYAAISESIPKAVRARVFALVYALPVTFLGGIDPAGRHLDPSK